MAKLFSPIKLGELDIKNRIVMAPMCINSSEGTGHTNDWHFVHYVTRAVGGVGLIILEATSIESNGRITDRDLGIWDDSHIEGLKKIVEECKKNGTAVGIQLGHAGRKCEIHSEDIIAPSAIPFDEFYKIPTEMTKNDISRVVHAFKMAAVRAEKAGFDLIELHAAHGYLINQFLSPLTNKRLDEYGGSPENRVRFLKEIVISIREVWGKDKPLIIRVSAEEYQEGGNSDSDVSELLEFLKDMDIDMIDVSSGGVVPTPIDVFPGYQIRFAENIKKKTGFMVIAGGLIKDAVMAEEMLQNHRCDMVFFGREFLRNPYFTLQAANELEEAIEWPKQYIRSKIVRKNTF